MSTSKYNPNLAEEENVQIFKEEYADQIKQAKEQMIKNDLKDYHTLLQSIESMMSHCFMQVMVPMYLQIQR